MKRWYGATLIGVFFASLNAVPIAAFFRTEPVQQWSAHTWVVVLIPNVLLLLLIAGLASGVYLLATRPR